MLQEKLTSGVVVPVDKRGKYSPRPNAVPKEAIEKVKQHIESFPRDRSHYSISENVHREYLPENLSIAEMYGLYVKKYESASGRSLRSKEKTVLVSEWMYRKIFNEEFNLSFSYPRSDTCEKCDYLKNVASNPTTSDEGRDSLTAELAEHQKLAGEGYQRLKKDTEYSKRPGSKALVMTFDMMQNTPVPSMTHQSMYYLRQLYVIVLGIHQTSDDAACLYAWDESTAGRGPDEIASCLTKHVSLRVKYVRHLICYSDNCFGQNKNFLVMCLFNTLINEKKFVRIDHKFLVRGHTYLPNDRDFGQIEKKKRGRIFYTPGHYINFLREARPKKPFIVDEMTAEDILDHSSLTRQYTDRKKDITGKAVLKSKALWINYGEGEAVIDGKKTTVKHPGVIWLRFSYSEDEPWKRGEKEPAIFPRQLRKYPAGNPINALKLGDLRKMIPYLPPQYVPFYDGLTAATSHGSDSEA